MRLRQPAEQGESGRLRLHLRPTRLHAEVECVSEQREGPLEGEPVGGKQRGGGEALSVKSLALLCFGLPTKRGDSKVPVAAVAGSIHFVSRR